MWVLSHVLEDVRVSERGGQGEGRQAVVVLVVHEHVLHTQTQTDTDRQADETHRSMSGRQHTDGLMIHDHVHRNIGVETERPAGRPRRFTFALQESGAEPYSSSSLRLEWNVLLWPCRLTCMSSRACERSCTEKKLPSWCLTPNSRRARRHTWSYAEGRL